MQDPVLLDGPSKGRQKQWDSSVAFLPTLSPQVVKLGESCALPSYASLTPYFQQIRGQTEPTKGSFRK